MLKRISNWMDKPWTNGTYCKICLGAGIAYAIVIAGIQLWFKWSEIVEKIDDIRDKLTSFFSKKKVVHFMEDEAD